MKKVIESYKLPETDDFKGDFPMAQAFGTLSAKTRIALIDIEVLAESIERGEVDDPQHIARMIRRTLNKFK